MAKKGSDIIIFLIMLLGTFSFLTFMINGFDESASVSSNLVSDQLSLLEDNLSEVNSMQSDFQTEIDNTSALSTGEDSSDKGGDAFGIFNIFSKNILFRFLTQAENVFGVPAVLIAWLTLLFGAIITIAVIAFIRRGDT